MEVEAAPQASSFLQTEEINAIRAATVQLKLFDASWYMRRYRLRLSSPDFAIQEFFTEGALAGRAPNALFDPSFYARNYMTTADIIPAFWHYIKCGISKSSWPHPLVDTTFVHEQLKRLGVSDFPLSAMLHKSNALELDPHPAFSVKFYRGAYSDVSARRAHAVIHYIENGAREMRIPHPLFWPEWFNAQVESGRKPPLTLVDYLDNLELHTVPPNPFFDLASYYGADLKNAGINPLYHYLRFGQREVRSPNRSIDPEWMLIKFKHQLALTRLDPLSFLLTNDNGLLFGSRKQRPLAIVNASSVPRVDEHWPTAIPHRSKRSRRKRILFVSHNLKVQGAQTSLFELAVGMKRQFNHHVDVLAPDDGPMKARYAAEGISTHRFKLPVKGLPESGDYNKLLSSFKAHLVEFEPDVVHGNTIQSYHALAVAAQSGIPTIWNIRESESPRSHGSDYFEAASILLQSAISSVSRFVFVSSTTKDLWKSAFPALQADVIQNGIDYSRLMLSPRQAQRDAARAVFGIKNHDIMLLSVGTWTERKGQRDIVQAMEKIDRRLWPRIRLVMIGATDTPYAAEIRHDLAELPAYLRDRVFIAPETSQLSERANVLQAYIAADLLIFTSRIESYPRVISEGMYFGLPIISTPCFGVTEQLESGISGLFYEPGAISDLAGAVQRFVTDPVRRQSYGNAAKYAATEKVMQYDDMLRRYEAVYSELLS